MSASQSAETLEPLAEQSPDRDELTMPPLCQVEPVDGRGEATWGVVSETAAIVGWRVAFLLDDGSVGEHPVALWRTWRHESGTVVTTPVVASRTRLIDLFWDPRRDAVVVPPGERITAWLPGERPNVTPSRCTVAAREDVAALPFTTREARPLPTGAP